ncbi:2815_t:CDS:2, partial [Dentiscutata heterogama]
DEISAACSNVIMEEDGARFFSRRKFDDIWKETLLKKDSKMLKKLSIFVCKAVEAVIIATANDQDMRTVIQDCDDSHLKTWYCQNKDYEMQIRNTNNDDSFVIDEYEVFQICKL